MKLGRLPRKFNPRIPHLSALLAGKRRTLAPPPSSADYTLGMPAALGMFANDSLGDCTCAALYHALQVWSLAGQGTLDTEPDNNAVLLYEQTCGYVPGDAATDQGGVEQDVLSYAMLAGIPIGADGSGQHRITAFVEVDPANQADVKLAIAQCGVAYIGFDVPDYAMNTTGLWDVQPGKPTIVGGHAVVLAAYDSVGPTCITWGRLQKMTWAFFDEYTDEAYAVIDKEWVRNTGLTPAGGTLEQLETQMAAIRDAA